MSRFNTVSTTKTENLAGGQAYSLSPESELAFLVLTSFSTEQFYRSSDDTFERIRRLITKSDKKIVAQIAVFARTKHGMRSITHVVASELAKHISGEKWAKEFYASIVYRPDDMMEILSYHKSNGKVTNAMKKGFAAAFDKFDRYSLAKYRGTNKSVKLVDVVNLCHPVPIEKNKEAIETLIKGTLTSFDTWEKEVSEAGQKATNEEEKSDFKNKAWSKLISEKKIGYFALLRNLRNILEDSPDSLSVALEMLVDEQLIKKSLVMPFRFSTAYDEILKINGTESRRVLSAITQAVDVSLNNVPKFEGETLVVLDVSYSMTGRPSQIGALFSSVLIKAANADFMVFADNAQYRNVNTMDSTLTIANSIRFSAGGTNFHSIFKTANRPYDRIIILSDMQGWMEYHSPVKEFKEYCIRTKSDPFVYSFDLAGYGTIQFPSQKVFCLAGFSDKIFDVMGNLETDRNALLNEIKKTEF